MQNRDKHKRKFLRGDTLIEVMFAVGIFGLVSISAIALMNRGLYSAQGALEITMARNEIDAQAEALRFIHNAYISEQDGNPSVYTELWNKITDSSMTYTPTTLLAEKPDFFTNYNNVSCDRIYYTEEGNNAIPLKAFVINPRLLDATDLASALSVAGGINNVIIKNSVSNSKLAQSGVYPRLVYGNTSGNESSDTGSLSDVNTNIGANLYRDNNFQSAEGIWVVAVAEGNTDLDATPDYYDFYIRTCWDAPGGGNSEDNSSTTISTTIRLYNPDAISLECIVSTPGQTCSSIPLEQSGIFIVMTWSGSNSDIDAHLIGPNDGLGHSYHVYYPTNSKHAGENKEHQYVLADGTTQSVTGYTIQLDVDALGSNFNYNTATDDWNSGGHGNGKVEVIAIRSLYPSNFHYYVYDFAGGGLSGQNLRVRVYVGYAANGVGQWPRYNEPILDCWYDSGCTARGDSTVHARTGDPGSRGYWDITNIVVEGTGSIQASLINHAQTSAPSL